MKFKIEIYYPIVPDFKFEDYPFHQKELVITEIGEILKNGFYEVDNFIDVHSSSLAIEGYKSDLLLQHLQLPSLWKEDNLKFEIIVEVNLSLLEVEGKKVTENIDKAELMSFLNYSLANKFGYRVFELLILSQVVRPGSLVLREGEAFINGKRHQNIIPSILNLREEIEFQQKRNYPQIEYLEFKPYYNWIIKNNLLFPMKPINSYQKALNNLSYINGIDNQIGRFVYQMRILEEIYTKGNNQITEQLDTKIQLFIGKMETFKKQIRNMYKVRSQFMHGVSPIVPFHKNNFAFNNYDESYDKEIDEASFFSLLLIISTLQKMYLNDYVQLNYEYIITPP